MTASPPFPDANTLKALAAAVASGAVAHDASLTFLRAAGFSDAEGLSRLLSRLREAGAGPSAVTACLVEVAAARDAAGATPTLVASGPRPLPGVRDTATVVEHLFRAAERELIVVGYALHGGPRILKSLAARLDADPSLDVVLCLDVSRIAGDTSTDADVVARWMHRFRSEQWPGVRMPALYHDPRALSSDLTSRAVLHAKCVVADRRRALVTSANLTVAAQDRNVEFGLLVEDASTSNRIALHFRSLIADGALVRLSL